jgi:S1-C subfamily serine protease
VSVALAEDLDLSVDSGVYVMQVSNGSPAERAGLRAALLSGADVPTDGSLPEGGDVIVAVDGQDASSIEVGGSWTRKKVTGFPHAGPERGDLEATAEWPS